MGRECNGTRFVTRGALVARIRNLRLDQQAERTQPADHWTSGHDAQLSWANALSILETWKEE
jgi:hypothetical protein